MRSAQCEMKSGGPTAGGARASRRVIAVAGCGEGAGSSASKTGATAEGDVMPAAFPGTAGDVTERGSRRSQQSGARSTPRRSTSHAPSASSAQQQDATTRPII
jgi:hypothetical protein